MRASVLLVAAASVVVAATETVEIFGGGDGDGEKVLLYSLGSVSCILFLPI